MRVSTAVAMPSPNVHPLLTLQASRPIGSLSKVVKGLSPSASRTTRRTTMEWLAGLIGGLVGAAGAVGSQWMQSHLSYKRDVQQRSEGALLRISGFAARIMRLWDTSTDRHGTSTGDADRAYGELVKDMWTESLLVSDVRVRERLQWAQEALSMSYGIRDYGGIAEVAIARNLAKWVSEVCGACLRGDDQPIEPAFISEYKGAISDALQGWEESARAQEALRQAELAERRTERG
jgi:hypothetical protein